MDTHFRVALTSEHVTFLAEFRSVSSAVVADKNNKEDRIGVKHLNLLSVIVVLNATIGRSTMRTVTAVEVIRVILDSTKPPLMRIIPAAGASGSTTNAASTHVVDYGVHEDPQQHQTTRR